MPRAVLFCTVVDNYGDAGIAWRLARALAQNHGFAVHLVVDHLLTLAALVPTLATAGPLPQEVLPGLWVGAAPPSAPADLVIEVLTAELPQDYLAAMAAAPQPPVWLVYEHLSAEDWVAGCHLKPSPHPRLPLTRYFFYPGVQEGTGGLLWGGRDATRPLANIQKSNEHPSPRPSSLKGEGGISILLFPYENAAVSGLLAGLSAYGQGAHLLVPQGRIWPQLSACLNIQLEAGRTQAHGPLQIEALPFTDQDTFADLVAGVDLACVRGEDSFVMALMAGVPLLWHIYNQEDGAHLAKLDAFCEDYTKGMRPALARVFTDLHRAWNVYDRAGVQENIPKYMAFLPELRAHAQGRAEKIKKLGGAAQNIVDFFGKVR